MKGSGSSFWPLLWGWWALCAKAVGPEDANP